jgi:integral membrane sensor domain MASE1
MIFVIPCEIETHGLIVLRKPKLSFPGWRDWKIMIVLFQGFGTRVIPEIKIMIPLLEIWHHLETP